MIEEIGDHRVMCGDITAGAVDLLMGYDRADVIYSDPPWGPGNQQYWHTMRERGARPRTSWDEFLDTFCRVCAKFRKPRAPVFVEMGIRWTDQLDEAMLRAGLRRQRQWAITYGPKSQPRPNTLTLYGPHDIAIELPSPPHGEPVTRSVLVAVVRPGALVLDPCTGLGMTSRIAHALGARFRGTEMNAARLARTRERLQKLTAAI